MRRLIIASVTAVVALAWGGCKATQQTEYVAAVSTQVRVPRDLKSIRFSIRQGGVSTFCRGYRVYDGRVQLPRSLGTYANNPDSVDPIVYTITGYTKELGDGGEFDDECKDNLAIDTGARILKRSRQPYVKDEVLLLPLPLKYSCFDKVCGPEETCRGGRCVNATVADPKAVFPPYLPELVDGTGGSCFSTSLCLAAAAPAITVDPDNCTYALVNSGSEPPLVDGGIDPVPGPVSGDGLNVEVVYDGGYNKEVLDKDPEDGFFVPDPSKPQQFRLAPGLCDLVKGYDPQGNDVAHRITAIRASGTCRSKITPQPICAADAFAQMGLDANGIASQAAPDACKPIEIRPPKAALMVVVDDTVKHKAFFEQAGDQVLKLSLSDPAFTKTDIGLVYTPGSATPTCGGPFPGVAPELARDVKGDIASSLAARAATLVANESPFFAGGLANAYATLSGAQYATYFRKAVLLVGNRKFDENVCAPDSPTARAAAALTPPPGHAAGIQTYVFAFTLDPDNPADTTSAPPPVEADQLAVAGGTGPVATGAKGNNKGPAKDRFQDIVNSLATCVYELDPAQNAADTELSYTDPNTGLVKKIVHAPSCNGETASGNGFGRDATVPNRVHVCGQACADYRTVLRNASLLTLLYNQPPPAVPIFAHKKACAPPASP